MVWRGRRGVGQKNLINTDKILLFKHKPFIPISLQAPLSLQSFLAMPAPAHWKLVFKHSTIFPGCLHIAVLLLQSCVHLISARSLLACQVLCMLSLFYPSNWVGSALYMPQIPAPLPASSRKWLIGISCLGSPCEKLTLRLEEATKVSIISIASFPFSVHKLYCCNCTYSRELYGCR